MKLLNTPFRMYSVYRKPTIVHSDTGWTLPAKKGVHLSIGFEDPSTGEAVLLQLSRRQAISIALSLLEKVRNDA